MNHQRKMNQNIQKLLNICSKMRKQELFLLKKQQILLDLVRQRFASIVWTHKIHEKQADIIYRKYQIIMTANIVITAFTTCGILALFKTNDCIVKSLTCLLSFITTLTSVYIKHFDSLIDYKTYKKSANEFSSI